MPKLVDKDERQRAFLEAAKEEFAARGFADTRMQDIARRANVSKGLLYEYFTSKEDIFLKVCEALVPWGPLSKMDGVPSAQAFVDVVADVARSYDKAQHFFLILTDFWATILRGPEKERTAFLARVESFYETPRRALTQTIQRGQKAGVFRPEAKAAVIANMIIAGIEGIRLQHMLDARRARKTETLRVLTRLALSELVGSDTADEPDMRGLAYA